MEDPPENLIALIAWLNNKLYAIPEPYRETAIVEMDAELLYDRPSLTYQISYRRPETDEEETQRENYESLRNRRLEAHELEMLKKLKEKYEPN